MTNEMIDKFVLPGDFIQLHDVKTMVGHGLKVIDGQVIATLRGIVRQTGEYITVLPFSSFYQPNIGDVVIGRVSQILKRNWKVNIGSSVLASLNLASVFIPEEDVRRRSMTEDRNMRDHFDVGDLVCVEIQFARNESVSIAVREHHYQKLIDGVMINIPCRLIKRVSQHLLIMTFNECKFDCIFGLNGSIWLSPLSEDGFKLVPRIRNCILLLATYEQLVYPDKVMEVFSILESYSAFDVLSTKAAESLGFIKASE